MAHRFCPALVCFLLSFATTVLAQSTSGTGVLTLQFLDSRSGVAVRPSTILIDGAPTASLPDSSGLLQLKNVRNGEHQLEIEAPGHQSFAGNVTVDGKNTLVQTFELDPLPGNDDTETTPAQNEAVLRGYVVDDLRGTPLSGAQVTVFDKGASAVSDTRGKYSIRFTTQPLKSARGERVTLSAAHEGYRAMELRSVEVPAGSITTLPIRMSRLEDAEDSTTSTEIIDDIRSQRNYDWVFDVTLR